MKLLFLQENPMYEALGLHALAGQAKAAGHQCDLLIESEEPNFDQKIKEIEPDLIAFSFMTRQQEWALYQTNRIKKFLDCDILLGGTHPTMYPETLEHCDADYLCLGEGEIALVELLDAMQAKLPTNNIANIHAKQNAQIYKNPIRPLIQSWDELALPDREVYGRYPFLGELPLKRFYTSIGCAYKCSFCYINNYREIYKGKGKFFRRKSVERAIHEIKSTQKDYPMKRIHFVDDIFSLDKKWLKQFLPRYKAEIDIAWTANVWIAHMDDELVQLFKESHCVGLTFGVEAGSEVSRRELIDKNLSNETYIKNCNILKKYKIPFHTGNIIGLPGEGLNEAFETAIFNRQIGATSTRSGLFWPFPGTQLTQYAIDHGLLSEDYGAKYLNKGIYPKVKHKQVDELTLMANLFHLVAKWPWFEKLTHFLLRYPRNPAIKLLAKLVDQSFWFHEAKFFGMLNYAGFKYWLKLKRSLSAMREHNQFSRYKDDLEAHRPLWNISNKDLQNAYETSKDGFT